MKNREGKQGGDREQNLEAGRGQGTELGSREGTGNGELEAVRGRSKIWEQGRDRDHFPPGFHLKSTLCLSPNKLNQHPWCFITLFSLDSRRAGNVPSAFMDGHSQPCAASAPHKHRGHSDNVDFVECGATGMALSRQSSVSCQPPAGKSLQEPPNPSLPHLLGGPEEAGI